MCIHQAIDILIETCKEKIISDKLSGEKNKYVICSGIVFDRHLLRDTICTNDYKTTCYKENGRMIHVTNLHADTATVMQWERKYKQDPKLERKKNKAIIVIVRISMSDHYVKKHNELAKSKKLTEIILDDNDFELKSAKPCKWCVKKIQDTGIKKVKYSNEEGKIVSSNIQNWDLEEQHLSDAQRKHERREKEKRQSKSKSKSK